MGLNRRAARRDANEPAIISGLKRCGWFVQQLSIPDFPDLLIAKAGRICLVEVKMPKKGPSDGQREKAGELSAYGVKVFLARDLNNLLSSLGETDPG